MKAILLLLLVSTGTLCLAQTGAKQELVTEFDRIIAREFKDNMPGGVALVAQKGQILYKKAFGMANMELDVPMKDSMVFFIGSLTKQFTAMAILQLVEKGKLSLRDDIRKYLPDYKEQTTPVTIEHLLSHTSGLATEAAEKDANTENIAPARLVDLYRNAPASFAAGTKWEYNNANYYLLGLLIEQLSGRSYGEYLEENIFKPAGMAHTCYCTDDRLIRNIATGYKNSERGIVHDKIKNIKVIYASGGIQSTAEDLYRWHKAMWSNLLVKAETFQKMVTSYTLTNGNKTGYGYGLHIQDIQGSKTLRHGGGMHGFISEAIYLPAEEVSVIILHNAYGKAPIGIMSRLMAAYTIGKPYRFTEIKLANSLVKKYPGVYINAANEWIIITEDSNELYFQRPGGIKYRVKASEEDNFFFPDKNYLWIRFNKDSTGNPASLSFSQAGLNSTDWYKSNTPAPHLLPTRLPDSLLKQYAGLYTFPNGDTLSVVLAGAALDIRQQGTGKVTIFAGTDKQFIPLKEKYSIEFRQDIAGITSSLLWKERGKRREAKKQR